MIAEDEKKPFRRAFSPIQFPKLFSKIPHKYSRNLKMSAERTENITFSLKSNQILKKINNLKFRPFILW
jgi:hypothetical protein